MKARLRHAMILGLAAWFASSAWAQITPPGPAAPMGEERIYGSELMTPQERQEYRDRMQSATTAEERERIRAEHHEQMMERAKEQGVTLPDMPPAHGQQMGPGSGMGPGGGMAPGEGRGRGMGGGRP